MSVTQALFSQQLLLATLLYLGAILLTEVTTARLHSAVEGVEPTAWVVVAILQPLLRAAALILFIITAYPTLFGHLDLPPVTDILFAGQGRMTTLVNITFLLSLLLPIVLRVRGLVLPIQGALLSALLFNWATAHLVTPEIVLWPGLPVVAGITVMSYLAHLTATTISHTLGERLNRWLDREGVEQLLFDGLLLLFQTPAILLYTLTLGQQLPIG